MRTTPTVPSLQTALRSALVLTAGLLALAAPARAAELQVLSAGAVRGVVPALAAAFERETGHTVHLVFDNVGALADKAKAGAPADLLVLTPAVISALKGSGLLRDDSAKDLGTVLMGVAVPVNAAAPDVSSPEALRAALLAAHTVIYSDPTKASSGIHFASIIERMGIAEQIKAKARIVPTGLVAMEELARQTEPAISVTQITEILPNPGVKLVAPLPGPLQKPTTYTGVLGGKAASPEAALAFLNWLSNAESRKAFVAAGFSVP